MKIRRIAAFSSNGVGGNPAGVVLSHDAVAEKDMRRVAAEVNYSETAFAFPVENENSAWRVRYFSPETEVPFCGHATIALGAALGKRHGPGTYQLQLNEALISVDVVAIEGGMSVTLASPPTSSKAMTKLELNDVLNLLGLRKGDLNLALPPARIHAGADHLMLAVHDGATLAAMSYDLDQGRKLMLKQGIVTIMLVHVANTRQFSVRNAFASGGVLEDPATGAAAAAFAGYLRDQDWPHGGRFTIHQGEDMGSPSLIQVQLSGKPGSSVRVSGLTHDIIGPF